MLSTLPMFVIFGLALPWEGWIRLGWLLPAIAVAAVLLRRLPVLGVMLPVLRGPLGASDVLFLGWFGPIGVAAIYYATFAVRHTGETIIWEATSAAVLVSILAHGVTAAPLSRLHKRADTGVDLTS